MFSENHTNQSCEFAAETLSYLYGEIGDAERARIETHLSGCAACADDAMGFAAVRSSIKEWRKLEFDNLNVTPLRIPFAEPREPAAPTWLENLRNLFSFSPRLLTASLALLAVFSGLALFFMTRAGDRNLAENYNRSSDIPTALPAELTPKQNTTPPEIVSGENRIESPGARETGIKNEFSRRASAAPKNHYPVKALPSPAHVKNRNAVKPARRSKTVPPGEVKPPTLADSGDASEDKSLRLADILEEISMR